MINLADGLTSPQGGSAILLDILDSMMASDMGGPPHQGRVRTERPPASVPRPPRPTLPSSR